MRGAQRNFPVFVLTLICCAVSTGVHAWSWKDLWLTPHQQASREMKSENYEALTTHQNTDWQGVGHYQLGEHAAAAERFADGESVSSQYNHATTLTRAGEYEKAIELFDEVLEQQPAHEKALKNRDIARQLQELQQEQQQQQQQDSQEGESEENNEEQQSSEQNQSNSAENQDSQSSQDEQNSESQAEEDQASEAEEEQKEASTEENDDAAQQQALQDAEVPLSEDQQATEQWLRKIPDDPAGLLRRKLRRNHAAEYPNVVNGESPW